MVNNKFGIMFSSILIIITASFLILYMSSGENLAGDALQRPFEEGNSPQPPHLPTPPVTESPSTEDITQYLLDSISHYKTDLQTPKRYIVEFYEKPLSETYVGLNRNEDASYTNLNGNKAGKAISSIESEISLHNSRLISEHQTKISEIKQKTSLSDENILGTFKNSFNGAAIEMTDVQASILLREGIIKRIYPDTGFKVMLMDAVPLIGADTVWNYTNFTGTGATGRGVTIAIIDTGVDYNHPDLGGCLGEGCKVKGGYDFVNSDDDPMDDSGHGTHVAGIAAGEGALKGVAPDAQILAYKVFDTEGLAYGSQIMEAIERALDPNMDNNLDDHADIISMSLGGPGDPFDPLSRAVDAAVLAGSVVVVSAGNEGPWEKTISSPGTSMRAITVGATYKTNYESFEWDCTPNTETQCGPCSNSGTVLCDYWGDTNSQVDEITSFSSRGPVLWNHGGISKPDILAPGAFVCAARFDNIFPEGEHPYYKPCFDDSHVAMAGTSMAAPVVSGAVALIKEAHPDWTPAQIKYSIRETADPIDGDINTVGYGRINVKKAIELERPYPVAMLLPPEREGNLVTFRAEIDAVEFGFYELSIYFDLPGETPRWTRYIHSMFTPGENVLFIPEENVIFKGELKEGLVGGWLAGRFDMKLLVADKQDHEDFEDRFLVGPKGGLETTDFMAGGWVVCGNRTITVAKDGSGDFTTIEEALEVVSCGNTILVKEGEYVINDSLEIPVSDITLKGEGDDKTIIFYSPEIIDDPNIGNCMPASHSAIKFGSKSNLKFESFSLITEPVYIDIDKNVWLTGGIRFFGDIPDYASDIEIKDVKFKGFYAGVVINGPYGVRNINIMDSYFSDVPIPLMRDMPFGYMDNITFERNHVIRTIPQWTYVDRPYSEAVFGPSLGYINDFVVRNNTFINNITCLYPGFVPIGVYTYSLDAGQIPPLYEHNLISITNPHNLTIGVVLDSDNYVFKDNLFEGEVNEGLIMLNSNADVTGTRYSPSTNISIDYFLINTYPEINTLSVTNSEFRNSTLETSLLNPKTVKVEANQNYYADNPCVDSDQNCICDFPHNITDQEGGLLAVDESPLARVGCLI